MATTALWRVKGKVSDAVKYIGNPDKTDTAIVVTKNESVSNLVAYVSREDATNRKQFVYGINCSTDNAVEEMQAVKKRFRKEDGTLAYHGYQSFKEGEVTPEKAHLIGIKLANELWGDKYQVLIATHLDKQSHIHNHFLINTVSFVDGIKFFRSTEDYRKMRHVSDRLCRENGLSVISRSKNRGRGYSDWEAEKNGIPTYRSLIRKDIDNAIAASITDIEFFDYMKKAGYEFKFYSDTGRELKRPSLKPYNAERFFRFDRLGEEYDLDVIMDRILEKIERTGPFTEEEVKKVHRYRTEHPPKTKAKGLAALYYYYAYHLGIVVRYPQAVRKVSSAMREDMLKLKRLDDEVRLLSENHIESLSDLEGFLSEAKTKAREYTALRTNCRTDLRKPISEGDLQTAERIKKRIAGLSQDLKELRKLIAIASRIRTRADKVSESEHTMEKERAFAPLNDDKITDKNMDKTPDKSERKEGTR